MDAIRVHNLTRSFGATVAVDRLSFAVPAGELFGFLGPNGAGKTTTIKLLTGQLRPTAGAAHIFGHDVATERAAIAHLIGVVFEAHNLYERMSAQDNLRFVARLYGVNGDRVQHVLAQVGLVDVAGQRTKTFSNGMQQRLVIARALLHRPRLLFLDEPTKGLDPAAARDIRQIALDLKQDGVTIFLTTHYMEEADRLCDRVAILDHGQIVALDAPATLKARLGAPAATLEEVFLNLTGRPLTTASAF